MTSTHTILKDAIVRYSHLLGDVGAQVYLEGLPKYGWRKYSNLFCDNIVLWCLVEHDEDCRKKPYLASIRNAFKVLRVTTQDVKVLGHGKVWDGNSDIPKSAIKKFKDEHGNVALGYVSVKVTLREWNAVDVLGHLPTILRQLDDDLIYLHDIDIATDCHYVTSRDILERYLKDIIPDVEIRDDRRKVGNHCLSWYMTTDKEQRIRCKVYNKFVQHLESAEVRKTLGSRMEDLVANSDKAFTKRLLDARDKGITRLELTFYGAKARKYKYYERVMGTIKDLIKKCRTYRVSYEAYWRYMVSNVTAMIGVYIKQRRVFAYCHWWNSVTGKLYGSQRGNISKQEAMVLLANYSFNDRPAYFVEVDVDDDNTITTKLSTYIRARGCKAITLVAGGSKGLYPYKYHKDVLDFTDVGLVSCGNITVGWPKRRIFKGALPLASIVLQDKPDDEGHIRVHHAAIHTADYRAGYVVLEVGKEYTIVELTFYEYRGKAAIFAITACGIRVRCGNSLTEALQEWLDEHPDEKAPYLTFKATSKRKIRGTWDIVVDTTF
jgi:hypothetical protein